MMGEQKQERELFSYAVNLEKRVRSDHPLRQVAAAIDFGFVRTVAQCVRAGLVDGDKLHVDSSFIEADAAKESVIKGPPELIAALKRAYQATESKLEDSTTP